jgi:hypothetical protein
VLANQLEISSSHRDHSQHPDPYKREYDRLILLDAIFFGLSKFSIPDRTKTINYHHPYQMEVSSEKSNALLSAVQPLFPSRY